MSETKHKTVQIVHPSTAKTLQAYAELNFAALETAQVMLGEMLNRHEQHPEILPAGIINDAMHAGFGMAAEFAGKATDACQKLVADFYVLPGDPLELKPDEIRELRMVLREGVEALIAVDLFCHEAQTYIEAHNLNPDKRPAPDE